QLAHVERSPRMAQQVREVAQADRVLHPHDPPLVGEGPDIALVVEVPRGARPALRWRAGIFLLTSLALRQLWRCYGRICPAPTPLPKPVLPRRDSAPPDPFVSLSRQVGHVVAGR